MLLIYSESTYFHEFKSSDTQIIQVKIIIIIELH